MVKYFVQFKKIESMKDKAFIIILTVATGILLTGICFMTELIKFNPNIY